MLLKRLCYYLVPVFLVFLFILVPLLHKSRVIDVDNILQQYYTKHMDSSSSKSFYKPQLYYNLSCPFEWSKYSCIHQDNMIKANLSLNYYLKMHNIDINQLLNKSLRNRRIFLVGDSLMRQIFIAIGCLSISSIKSYDIDWMSTWPCHNMTNCIESNEHSGFNLGRIKFENGNEVYFKPLAGSRVNEPNIISRFMKELTTHGYISFGPILSISSKQLQMTNKDILVINLGVHDNEINNIKYNELSIFGKKIISLQKSNTLKTTVPQLIYILSPTQHFGVNGIFNKNFKALECLNSVERNIRNELENKYIKINESVNSIISYNDTYLGYLHIGRGDCTHYCQQGLPDIVAENLFKEISTLLLQHSKKT